MAIRIKDIGASASKWSRNAQAATSDYQAGATNAGGAWEAATRAAASTYRDAIAAAGIADRFVRGVARAGASKYNRRIADVGVQRFGPGVAAAEGDWQSGFAPFQTVIAGLTLPQRRPRGDPGNLQRVAAVATALTQRRLANLSSGG